MRQIHVKRNALIAYLLAVLVDKGSDTSGNYGHRGRRGKRGGSLPGGGHVTIGVAPGTPTEDVREAIHAHQEGKAQSPNQLGALMRKRITQRYKRIAQELEVAEKEEQEATYAMDQNWKEMQGYYDSLQFTKEHGFPQSAQDFWSEKHEAALEKGADLFDAQVAALNRVAELRLQLRTGGVEALAVPKSQQATVALSTKIKDGRHEAQKGLDLFNQLCGTGTVNGEKAVVSRRDTSRACYTPLFFANKAGQVQLSKGDNRKIMLHEMGHWLEDRDPQIHQKALDFLARRTQGETPQKLKDIYPGAGYENYEITKRDKFYHAYTGKIYEEGGGQGQYATEIISMGLQHMYEDAYKFATKDPDFFDFMISTLRGR